MRGRVVAVAAALGAILALVGACAPATAAGSAIEVSRDGASWAATLPGTVFGNARLVPSDAITRAFYVRADLVGWPGENVAVSSARPCARLSEGPIIASGGVARVDLTALLGDLDGQRGQNGWAGFQIVLSLSGEPLGIGATACPQSGAEIAGYSPFPRGGGRYSGGSGFRYASTATGWVPTASTTGPLPTSTIPTTTPTTVPTADGIRVAANTTRFYQEYDAALWLVAALLGAAGAWFMLRRRPRAVPEDGHDPNGALR